MIVNNRIVEKEELIFFQWLNIYEQIKKEFKELPKYKQDNYRRKFEVFHKEVS